MALTTLRNDGMENVMKISGVHKEVLTKHSSGGGLVKQW